MLIAAAGYLHAVELQEHARKRHEELIVRPGAPEGDDRVTHWARVYEMARRDELEYAEELRMIGIDPSEDLQVETAGSEKAAPDTSERGQLALRWHAPESQIGDFT